MATVKKCDICGEVFDRHIDDVTAEITVRYGKSNHFESGNFKWLDTCPACTQKLLGFIDVIRNYPDNHCVTVFDNDGSEHTAN